MPILDLQMRLRELGRIRIGARTKTKSGKTAPKKLEQFRFSSPSRDLIEAIAGIYGGTPQEWEEAPGDGRQWEVYSEASEINVVLPPMEVVDQHYELWSGGGCQRRCDGRTEFISMKPCLCPPDPEERGELAGKGQACKPTTRLRVMLPEVAGVGVFRLETHGYYAAVELAGVAQLLAAATAQGVAIPAKLRLEQRERKSPGKATRKFAVPVIDVNAPIGAVLESVGALPWGGNAAAALPAPVPAPRELAPAPQPGRRGTQREPLPGPPALPEARGRPAEPEIPAGPPPPAPEGLEPPREDDEGPPPASPSRWQMNDGQRRRLHALRDDYLTHDELKAGIARWWGLTSTGDLSEAQYEALTATLEDPALRDRFVSFAIDAYAEQAQL